MENPREWFDRTVEYFEEKTRKNKDYTPNQIRVRALGETYNNWFLRFVGRSGIPSEGICPQQIRDVEEVVDSLGIDREKLYKTLERLDSFRSMSNPAFIDLDNLTREVLFAMQEQKGYDVSELVL